MLSSIQESFEKQSTKQGKRIVSSEDRNYLSYLHWEDTVEGDLFWSILYASYLRYDVYDYETLIKLYINYNTLNYYDVYTYDIYRSYFGEVKGTLTDEGFEKLIKKIEKC